MAFPAGEFCSRGRSCCTRTSSHFSLSSSSWQSATSAATGLGWLGWSWAVAFAAEYGSTRSGIPSGLYRLLNLGITGWIWERTLLGAGILVHVAVFLLVYALKGISVTRGWTVDRPAGERVAVITTTIDERGD